MANIGNHTFIDGVGDVRLHEGIVRMDLLALSATGRDKEGNPAPEFVSQLVMSPHAFLRMVSALGDTVKQMQDKGMLGDGGAAKTPAKAKAPAKKKAASKKKASPNF
ncbi:MAG: hypothetical protein HQ513_11325 [Rhodospirillales bacterium]|nr:hypothetical protein [Rhodospirillales bacterium]